MNDNEKKVQNQGEEHDRAGACCRPAPWAACRPDTGSTDSGCFSAAEMSHAMAMTNSTGSFVLEVQKTNGHCPTGEMVGQQNIREAKIPVLSCEGGCIRGEIARLAANMIAKEAGFARGCHGELVTVPDSAIAQWMRGARKVVLIDGCFLHCHGRLIEGLLQEDQLLQFDALQVYRKYTDVFDIDAVPEQERQEAARQVANHVLAQLECAGSNSSSRQAPPRSAGSAGPRTQG
jgi:uncharacterized metal-binding protein